MSDDEWWLNLYVLFSRVTCMQHMLLLRPPSRDLLERGPPSSVKAALEKFEALMASTETSAVEKEADIGLVVPPV